MVKEKPPDRSGNAHVIHCGRELQGEKEVYYIGDGEVTARWTSHYAAGRGKVYNFKDPERVCGSYNGSNSKEMRVCIDCAKRNGFEW